MARIKTVKSIDEKISETETNLRRLKERCDKAAEKLDKLYEEKKAIETKQLLDAIENSSKTRAEILAFLESE